MENSSSSKTRSPARVLAAFLAVVMLFIVMPVLPAGAAEPATVKNITFKNVDAGGYIFFDPDDNQDGNVSTINSVTESSKEFTWKGFETATAERVAGDTKEKTDVKVTLNTDATFDKSFAFALYKGNQSNPNSNVAVYWSNSKNGQWTPLIPVDEQAPYRRVYCDVYVIPQGGMGESVFIKVEESHTVTFSIDAGVTVKVGSVSEESTFNAGDTVYNSNSMIVPTSGLTFQAALDGEMTGYAPEVSVSNGAKLEENAKVNGVYTVKDVYSDVTVTVKLAKKSYTVNMDYTIEDPAKPAFTVNVRTGDHTGKSYGDSFEFTVATTAGYNAPEVKITKTKNGDDVYPNVAKVSNGLNTTYTILDIKQNLFVKIEAGELQKHTPTFPNGATKGFNILFKQDGEFKSGNVPAVAYGTDIEFKLTLRDGWTGTPEVTANGYTVSPMSSNDGWTYKYTIMGETTFDVTGLTQETYRVVLAQQTGVFTLNNMEQTAHYGESVTFTMTLADGWKLINDSQIVLLNGKEGLDEAYTVTVTSIGDSVCTIKIDNIDKGMNLTVDAKNSLEKKTFEVKVPTGTGFEATSSRQDNKVPFGEGVTFTIAAKPGYVVASVTCTIDNNTTTLTPFGAAANQYSVTNVRDNVTIEVAVKVLTYTVTYRVSSSTVCEGMGKTIDDGKIQVTKTYTITDDQLSYEEASSTYTLQLETPKRTGWVFKGWKNNRFANPVTKITFVDFTSDKTDEFDIEWAVDTSENTSDAFFYVVLKSITSKGNSTRFEAELHTNVNTEYDKADSGAALVLSHGFFYAKSESDYNNAITNGDLSKIAKTLNDGKPGLQKLETNVFYYKHDNADGVNGYEGVEFSLTLNGTDNDGGHYGAAWVLVSINGQTYLLISKPQQVQ